MTREEIVAIVLLNTGNRTDKQDLMLTAIDLALTEIGQVHPFNSMRSEEDVTLVAGASSVNLPIGTIGIWDARVFIPDDPSTSTDESDNNDVTYFSIHSKKTVVDLVPSLDRSSTGRPRMGYVDSGVLHVVPPADEGYTIRLTVYKSFSGLTTGASTPAGGLDSAIIAWVTAYVFRAIQNHESAAVWMQEYIRTLQLAIRNDNNKMHLEGRVHRGFRGGNMDRTEAQSSTPWLDPFARR